MDNSVVLATTSTGNGDRCGTTSIANAQRASVAGSCLMVCSTPGRKTFTTTAIGSCAAHLRHRGRRKGIGIKFGKTLVKWLAEGRLYSLDCLLAGRGNLIL